MKKARTAFLLSVLMFVGCTEEKITISVSPGGAISTPEAARNAVRAVKARFAREGKKVPAVEVVFADGVYRLEKPLELGPEDAGSPGSPIVWRAANKGGAVFNAAVALDWQKESDPEVLALLPPEARDKVLVAAIPGHQHIPSFAFNTDSGRGELPPALFAGDERLPRARWPNDAFSTTGPVRAEVDVGVNKLGKKDGSFKLKRTGRLAAWAGEPEPWLWGAWGVEWAEALIPLEAEDVAGDWIHVPKAAIPFGLKRAMPFYAFNMFCELDRPGEWVIERAKRRVHVWPKTDAPAELVIADGFVSAKNLTDIVFEGFVFEKCRAAALVFKDCSRITVRASAVRHTCSWGVLVEGGSDCRVAGCDMYDLGEGGVRMIGGDKLTLTPANHVADNNHIHHYGRIIHNYREGVSIRGVGNRATHNLVHHSDHTGIYFCGNDQYVGYNVVHDVCEYNDDAGAIYCWQNSWTGRGGIVEHNVVHMVGKKRYPRNTEGIYLDDYSSEAVVRNNIVNRACRGVFMGGGQSHCVYGNVLMNCSGPALLVASRQNFTAVKQGAKSYLWKEIDKDYGTYNATKWRERYPGLAKLLDFPDRAAANHGYWNVFTNNLFAAADDTRMSEGKAVEPYNTIADNVCVAGDPGLRDYAGFDWRAAPDSPHAALIDACRFDEAGLYVSDERFSPPVKFGSDLSPAVPFGEKTMGPPSVNLAVTLVSELPSDVKAFAEQTADCVVPGWSKGTWVFSSANCDPDPKAPWEEFAYSFVPTCDCEVKLVMMGGDGGKTLYDRVSVEGVEAHGAVFDKPLPIAASDKNRMMSAKLCLRKGVKVTVSYRAKAADMDR